MRFIVIGFLVVAAGVCVVTSASKNSALRGGTEKADSSASQISRPASRGESVIISRAAFDEYGLLWTPAIVENVSPDTFDGFPSIRVTFRSREMRNEVCWMSDIFFLEFAPQDSTLRMVERERVVDVALDHTRDNHCEARIRPHFGLSNQEADRIVDRITEAYRGEAPYIAVALAPNFWEEQEKIRAFRTRR